MAGLSLNEEQKLQLTKLRRRLEMSPHVFLPEERIRFFHTLDQLQAEVPSENEDSGKQDSVALQILLSDLKQLVLRLGKGHGLYQDALDALRSLAPEMVGEVERIAEQEYRQRHQAGEMAGYARQDRFEHRTRWLKEMQKWLEENEEEDPKGFAEFLFEEIQDAADRSELAEYIRKKINGILSREEVTASRTDFMERAETRIAEELKKEKSNVRLCRRLTVRKESLFNGWNPDDQPIFDAFLSIVTAAPRGRIRDEGERMVVCLLQTKVNSWEERQMMIDRMTEYCETATSGFYPDGNVDPKFAAAVAKIRNFSAQTVNRAEYPDDPQFGKAILLDEKKVKKAVDHVLGRQDHEAFAAKRSEAEEKVPPDSGTWAEGLYDDIYLCSLIGGRLERENIPDEAGKAKRIVVEAASIPENRKGYLDAATGVYYPRTDTEKLPEGFYFSAGGTLFRLTDLAQLNDLTDQLQFEAGREGKAAARIRALAKNYFINHRIRYSYTDETQRKQCMDRMMNAQEKIIRCGSDKYGMRSLQNSLRKYQQAMQRGDSAKEIAEAEKELMQNCRNYMAKVPEKIGRTTRSNLETVCDLFCGLQRERNFRQKGKQFDQVPIISAPIKSNYAWEMDDLIKLQEMAGENNVHMSKLLNPIEQMEKEKKYRTESFVRMMRALKECTTLDGYYGIREMAAAYCNLRQAALAFGEEMGWNGMDALSRAKDEKEKQKIALVQKLSRMGRSMNEQLLDVSEKIRDKSTPVGELMYRQIEADDQRRKSEKENSKSREPEKKEPVLQKTQMKK